MERKLNMILSIMVLILFSGCSDNSELSKPENKIIDRLNISELGDMTFSDNGMRFGIVVEEGVLIYRLTQEWNLSTGVISKLIDSEQLKRLKEK